MALPVVLKFDVVYFVMMILSAMVSSPRLSTFLNVFLVSVTVLPLIKKRPSLLLLIAAIVTESTALVYRSATNYLYR